MVNAKIRTIEEDSIAWDGGIKSGDTLLSINGHKIHDIFDYQFYSADENVLLVLQTPDGELYDVEIEKDTYEDIGISFENSMIDEDRRCSNKCIFCFIDQMPCNMRETLYFKDDDTRLSFLTGNYVTLTNVGKREMERIIKYRMSPINVSVHTTNPQLRKFMLGNKNAGDIMEKLTMLSDACITVNTQIVLCPGINDGEELKRTLNDLSSLSNSIASLSVVPIGITKYREGLYQVRPFTSNEAELVIDQIEKFQKEMQKKIRRNFVYAADEFYLKAGRPFPEYDEYDDFPQLENGVGMCRLLDFEVCDYLVRQKRNLDKKYMNAKKNKVSIATGVAAYDIINGLAQSVAEKYPNTEVKVYKIINNYFGDNITVAGLITGEDLISQLEGNDLGDMLMITHNMLRAGENVFLDDITTEQVSKKLNVKVCVAGDSGEDFVTKLLTGKACEVNE